MKHPISVSTKPAAGQEVHFDVQFVDCHPILEVAIQPVGLLDEQHPNGRMPLQIGGT
jgi:hypothetical protein